MTVYAYCMHRLPRFLFSVSPGRPQICRCSFLCLRRGGSRSLSLLDSTALGYVFGVKLRVLSVMIVFFLMGAAMLVFPNRAPDLYRANDSAIRSNRAAQIAIGTGIMLFSAWFVISIVYGTRAQALGLQPIVQAAIVAVAAQQPHRLPMRRLA